MNSCFVTRVQDRVIIRKYLIEPSKFGIFQNLGLTVKNEYYIHVEVKSRLNSGNSC